MQHKIFNKIIDSKDVIDSQSNLTISTLDISLMKVLLKFLCDSLRLSSLPNEIIYIIEQQFNNVSTARDIAALRCTSSFFYYNKQLKDRYDYCHRLLCSAGGLHTLLLTDGKLYGCGYNQYGQLGLGDCQNRHFWTQICSPLIEMKISQCILGYAYTLIATLDNKLYGCGDNRYGQLGLGNLPNTMYLTEIPLYLPVGVTIKQIVANFSHTLLLTSEGKLYGCGDNKAGQLGLGNLPNTMYFTEIPLQLPVGVTINQIAAGKTHTLILTSEGRLYGCGDNSNGQLGLEDRLRSRNLIEIPLQWPVNEIIRQISAGSYHTLILTSDDKLYGCGMNMDFQLGFDSCYSAPVSLISLPNLLSGEKIQQIVTGHRYTAMLISGGKLYTCGSNIFQLELNNEDNDLNNYKDNCVEVLTEVPCQLPEGVNTIQLMGGANFVIAMTSDGELYGYGANCDGQLALSVQEKKAKGMIIQLPSNSQQSEELRKNRRFH